MYVFLILLYILLIALAVPLLILFTQVCLSFTYSRLKKLPLDVSLTKATVLIPAHNESKNILPTIKSIIDQSIDDLNIVVIADNCEDDTAEVAKEQGVTVIERNDPTFRGKGYALDFGIQYLKGVDSPEVVVIIDADCLLSSGALKLLISECLHYKVPVQALYLMKAKAGAPLKTKIAELAWLVKNWVRPLGYHVARLPCHLMGSGMAFPWEVISQASLASGHIVEDVKLGIDLTKKGFPTRFLPESEIISFFPSNETGLKSQRSRWEHGHIGLILQEGPSLIFDSILKRNLSQLFIALDLIVPPLALLVILLLLSVFLSIVFFAFTAIKLPLVISMGMFLGLILTIFLAWYRYGMSVISFTELIKIPVYIASKIPLYLAYFFNRQTDWIRSKRD